MPADAAQLLDRALDEVVERYRRRTPRSAAAYADSCTVLPGGNTRSNLHVDPYPVLVDRAYEGVLVDIDGNEYDDFNNDYTVAVLGHSHPRIAAEVQRVLADGTNWGGRSTAEAELARCIVERFPAIEQLRFVNSGTEANLLALVTALDVTGRDTIVVFDGGYHGSTLSWVAEHPRINVPVEVLRLPYNDVDALRSAFAQQGGRIAAVFCELMLNSGGCIPATPEFAHELRAQCTASGALLVVDEVMTARLGHGGLQRRYGVRPDIVTLGKIIGGGFPIGAFGASAEVMAMYDVRNRGATAHGGSFNNEIFSMRCGVVAMRELLTEHELGRMNAAGDRLRESIQALFHRHDVPLVMTGIGSTCALHVGSEPPVRFHRHPLVDRLRRHLHLSLNCEGQWVAGRAMIATSLVTTDTQIDRLLGAIDDWTGTHIPLIRTVAQEVDS
jgi:glutamate-1-semialdehyde 2,1-aminomutase